MEPIYFIEIKYGKLSTYMVSKRVRSNDPSIQCLVVVDTEQGCLSVKRVHVAVIPNHSPSPPADTWFNRLLTLVEVVSFMQFYSDSEKQINSFLFKEV